MKWLSKLTQKGKIALGAVAVAVLGATGVYFTLESNAPVTKYPGVTLDHVVYGGDAGIATPQRTAIVSAIRAYRPVFMRLLGDNCYPASCYDMKQIIAHITDPFGDLGPQHTETDIATDGNHGNYSLSRAQREFLTKAMPMGKVKKSPMYGLKVYDNACEINWEGTVYDVKLGDPPSQKRQEAFVEKAATSADCVGKLVIGLTHQCPRGLGPRGNTSSGDYMAFTIKTLDPNFDYVICGHEHTTLWSGKFGRANYYLAGALAKYTQSAGYPGFLTLDGGKITIKYINGPITPATEDEE